MFVVRAHRGFNLHFPSLMTLNTQSAISHICSLMGEVPACVIGLLSASVLGFSLLFMLLKIVIIVCVHDGEGRHTTVRVSRSENNPVYLLLPFYLYTGLGTIARWLPRASFATLRFEVGCLVCEFIWVHFLYKVRFKPKFICIFPPAPPSLLPFSFCLWVFSALGFGFFFFWDSIL